MQDEFCKKRSRFCKKSLDSVKKSRAVRIAIPLENSANLSRAGWPRENIKVAECFFLPILRSGKNKGQREGAGEKIKVAG